MELNDETLYAVAPFAATLGIRIDRATSDLVRAHLPLTPHVSTYGGGMHGGALMSLADVAAALCAAANTTPDHITTTAESTTYFLTPLHGPTATAEARPVRTGKSLICVAVDIRDHHETLCARTTQLLAVTHP